MFKYLTQPLRRTAQIAKRSFCNSKLSGSSAKITAAKTATPTVSPLIEVRDALNGWGDKLKEAGVNDIDFNLKCIVSHVLQRKFVSHILYSPTVSYCKPFAPLEHRAG